jgi:adenylate kinase
MVNKLLTKWKAKLGSMVFSCVQSLLWAVLPPRFIILLGPPGIGKGTLAGNLAATLRIRQMSTGDAFRREKAANSELSKIINDVIARGGLVDDHITMAVVRRELMQTCYLRGAILDGVPRNLSQARLLRNMLKSWGCKVALVVVMEMDEAEEEQLIVRLENRLTCSNKSCGRTYNLNSDLPRREGHCDACDSPLYKRPDDVRAVIQARLATYRKETKPVTGFYADVADSLVIVKPISMTKEEVLATVMRQLS